MTSGRYPVKKTGSADNERLQINKALDNILDTLSRADQWDSAFSWGDHADENYATALSELEQFSDFGVPSTPLLSKTRETAPNGTESHAILAAWNRAGDDSIVYDLEIRESDPSVSIDTNNASDVIANSDLYSVPIISNDSQDTFIKYKAFFDSDTRYFFRVRIRRNSLVSNWSPFADIVTEPDEDVPPAPGLLTVSPIADGVRLDWVYDFDANPNVAKIEILRGGNVIDTVPRPALSYIDEPLPVQQQYNYSIRAVTFFGVSGPLSNVAGAFPNRSTVTIRASSEPTTRPDGSPLQDGDRWVDTANGDRPYVRVGNSWVPEYTEIPGNNINENSMNGNRIEARTLSADKIETGSLTADEIDVNSLTSDIITAGNIIVGGDNITNLTNNAGYTDFDAFDVQDAIDNNVTIIDGSKITTGTIDASEVNVINLNADQITTGTVDANRIDVSGVITAGNIIVGGDNITNLTNDAGYTDFDALDVESAIANDVTSISGSKIVTGTIDASQVNVTNINADNIDVGTLSASRIGDSSLDTTKLAGTLKSDNFDSSLGTDGWRIERSGNVILNDLVARGDLIAGAGTPDRVEIVASGSGDDANYIMWAGTGNKNAANGRFWIDENGNAKFGGRVSAAQLEGSFLDAVPFDLTSPNATDSTNTVDWITVGDRFLEFPETIDRPRRGFISASVPVFASPNQQSRGAGIRVQAKIQNADGTWPSSWTTIVQTYAVDTTTISSAAPVSAGTSLTGVKGFRFRVQFRAALPNESARANRYSGIFLALPSITGFNVKVDSTGGTAGGGTAPANPDLLVPPDFFDGWDIP